MWYYNGVNGGKGMKEKKYLIEIIQPLDMEIWHGIQLVHI